MSAFLKISDQYFTELNVVPVLVTIIRMNYYKSHNIGVKVYTIELVASALADYMVFSEID